MLIIDSDSKEFNLDEIHRGTLVCAQHSSWDEAVAGVVTGAEEDCIRVQFPPSVQNTLNHFFIYASEVDDGEWTIKYSDDLETISQYPEEESGGDEEDGS